MKKKFPIWVDEETHSKLRIESGKSKISMKKIVHDAVIEYIERHRVLDSDLDPDTIEKIKNCVEEIFKPKNVKRIWINNLIDKIAKKLNLEKYLVEKGVIKLINSQILIKDYRDEVLYDGSLEERIKILNNMDNVKEK
ncbi:hypothetical protein LCGC14_2340360 [marine sediment metagenome]|uniref:Uncharacterized protein n=1 Tax=marine sediment metagenome TaxID=412755 RepID=A0A0F9CC38_9ZZZZ